METKIFFLMLIGTVKNYTKNLFPFRSLVRTLSNEEFWAAFFFFPFKLHYKSIVDYSVKTRALDRKESKMLITTQKSDF